MSETNTVTCVDIAGNAYEVPLTTLRWRPSAYAFVVKEDKILLSRQFDGFDVPGGGVELGEVPEVAVIRETKEETGIDVANPRLVGLHSGFFKLPKSSKGELIQSLMIFYRADFVGGELSTDGFDEYEKIYAGMPEWLPLETLDSIKVASSFDWRVYVRTALHENYRH